MKPTCSNFEAKKRSSYVTLPPAGCYLAEIQEVRLGDWNGRETIEMMIEITEGEYAGRYHEVYKDQDERFGGAKYKGTFRLIPYTDDDEPWMKKNFDENMWCVQESNKPYRWDWDEKKLKGKKIGINVRNRLYTYNGTDRSTTEICGFETVDDVRNGKCKPKRDRDQREKRSDAPETSTDGSGFTEVSGEVSVPW